MGKRKVELGRLEGLAIEGGAAWGFAYVGALRVLWEELRGVHRYAGTSAGSILCLLLALGYELEEIESQVFEFDWGEFLQGGFFENLGRTLTDWGWYDREYAWQWLRERVEQKLGNPDATFADLYVEHHKELNVVVCNLSTGYAEVWNAHTRPDVPLAMAVVISMNIPGVFGKVLFDGQSWCDGGLQWNYPLRALDTKGQLKGRVLGLRVDSEEEIRFLRDLQQPVMVGKLPENAVDHALQVFRAAIRGQDLHYRHSGQQWRTLHINVTQKLEDGHSYNPNALDFGMEVLEKQALAEAGEEAALGYFNSP